MDFIMPYINVLPGALAQGLIWGLMAIGVYISYKILDIADLTVDGSICTGACVCAVLLTNGVPAWLAMIIAFIAGAATGVLTGLFNTALGIPSILAGILTQLVLYSVNLFILGGKSQLSINRFTDKPLLHMIDIPMACLVAGAVVVIVIILLILFFYTEVGLTLKSTGDNPDMSRAQGVNVNFNKVLGLAISNGIVALSGSLLAQYKGFADINDGRGAIVIGLAAIFIGLSVSMKIKPNLVMSLIGVIGGGVVYYVIYNYVILMGIKTDYLKMLSAIIVVVFLAIPYINGEYLKRPKKKVNSNAGGGRNA